MVIEDEVSGGACGAEARFHLHPAVRATMTAGPTVALEVADAGAARIEFIGADSVLLEDYDWHPQFGLAVPGRCVVARFLRGRLRTSLTWRANY
jgi:hypothetical protein